MELLQILDKVQNLSLALPVFQRGYVWKREQVRKLFSSLYHRNPVGSLLVWETPAAGAEVKGGAGVADGNLRLLLDGQQRITSAYGVIRGEAPAFFDGDAKAFTGLRFQVDDERFEFYQPTKMADDPLWVDVSKLMRKGMGGYIAKMARLDAESTESRLERLNRLHEITKIDIHIDEITGSERTTDEVVEIFNVVNSGGTKLSKGDLALAKICAGWPEARTRMKTHLSTWEKAGYDFNLDWLLRCLNTVLTGKAEFRHLDAQPPARIEEGLKRATTAVDSTLNLIAGQLGLDHHRVLFGRYAIPVMARYFDRHPSSPGTTDSDRLLFWYLQAAMWGRFSGSTETVLDRDLEALEESIASGNLDPLLERMRLWRGRLRVEPAHFEGWSLGARFYPVLYLLTRMGGARDFCSGLELKAGMLGAAAKLEVHHIFPKARLYERGYKRPETNSLANFCFLTSKCNKMISARLPEDYFRKVAVKGSLESQWIPEDEHLWRIENYREFLEERRRLLAEETNRRLADLLHGDTRWIEEPAPAAQPAAAPVLGGITSEEEERTLLDLCAWVAGKGLSPGVLSFDFSDPGTGEQKAVFDLAWPEGIQAGLTRPVAVLLDESDELLRFANDAGYRFFTSVPAFRRYVETEILGGGAPAREDAPQAGEGG